MTSTEPKRILFVAENVTTDQVTRLVSLAGSLPEQRFEVTFAASQFDPVVFDGMGFQRRRIHSLPRDQMLSRVAAGKQVYDDSVLRDYVEQERDLLKDSRPDLVVANFRPSLTVSAPLHGVPLATVVGAYWSPYAVRDGFPIPDHPTVKLVGLSVARRFLPKALPAAFALFAKPINELRRRHGLPAIGDLLDVMTWGDWVLHPDLPELAPTRGAPSHHHYLGRVPWSPKLPVPAWWEELPSDRPTLWVTLGSSGNLQAWPALKQGLAGLPINVMLATEGRFDPGPLPSNFWSAEWLPGPEAARRADLAVTNGGAGSSYQALAVGTPVLGLASNLDQHLAMTGIERTGAGRLLRAGSLSPDEVRVAVNEMLGSDRYTQAARVSADRLGAWDAQERFLRLVDQITRTPQQRVSA